MGTWYEIRSNTDSVLGSSLKCKYSDITEVDYRDKRENSVDFVLFSGIQADQTYAYCDAKWDGVYMTDKWL
jgi:hypothetical protein